MDMRHLPEKIIDRRGVLARRENSAPVPCARLARVEPERLSCLDKIEVEGLEVHANHGVFPEENGLCQKFVVSVTFFTDTRPAATTDDLAASIHYGDAAHAVDEFMRAHTFNLIETAAEGVAALLLDRYPSACAVRVKLEKPWAPVGLPLRSVFVEIARTRA